MNSCIPHSHFPERVLASAIASVHSETPDLLPVSITTCNAHSNDRAEILFSNGRTLVIKRARHSWADARFSASRIACGLIQRRTGVLAPRPLKPCNLPGDPFPVEMYWRIEAPTLGETWPTLARGEQAWALRHWGRLMARLHRIRFPGHGALPHGGKDTLENFLHANLETRLLPAARATWPEGVRLIDSLIAASTRIAARAGRSGVLVHNDLHMRNVLCERRKHSAPSRGVLDLESAFAGPPEADIAHAEVLHGPLLGQPLPKGWGKELRTGYAREIDPHIVAYFRNFHLANLGYYAALQGWAELAADLLRLTHPLALSRGIT